MHSCVRDAGFGKTWTGSNWIGMAAALNPKTHCGVICPTNNDTRRTAFEGQSGLLAMIPEDLIEDYNKSMMEITLKNGSKDHRLFGGETGSSSWPEPWFHLV